MLMQPGGRIAAHPLAGGIPFPGESRTNHQIFTRDRALIAVFLGALAMLVWFSSHLAAVRIYQVDECQNLFMARILATGQASEFFTNGSLFLLGPLSWIARTAGSSAEMFNLSRLLFFGIFWLNLLLLALIASRQLCSAKGLVALVAAATLAPLWDYGLEIRHDNLILTGMLLTWWAVRVKPMGMLSYVIAGAVVVASLFIAVKSVVYVVPLSCMILVFPPPGHKGSRVRLAIGWGMGAILALVLIRIAYGSGGTWDLYLSVFHGVTKYSASGAGRSAGFGPGMALARLLTQTPLLLGLVAASGFTVAIDLLRRRKAALTWDGMLPEVLLVVGAMGVLMVNPTPFPYNLLHIVPYGFVLVARYGSINGEEFLQHKRLWPIAGGMLLFSHLVPFGVATARHLQWQNFRQEAVMRRAEDLTDAIKDPVYDAIGMVPTRSSINFQWYLHSLNIQGFVDGAGPHVRDMLTSRPAAVFIPSYRTDWLPEEDHAFIREHYVSLADDFWVLGKVLPGAGGSFEITHAGRYRISSLAGSDIAGTYPGGFEGLTTPEADGKIAGILDGKPLTDGPVELAVGIHRIETDSEVQPAIVWVGPRVDRVHRFSQGDHQRLFFNWY
jgi:hypothetical protein